MPLKGKQDGKTFKRTNVNRCIMLGCKELATMKHPLINGMVICGRHHQAVSKVGRADPMEAPCMVSGLPFGACRGMGCHPAYATACFVCGSNKAAVDEEAGASSTDAASSLSPCQQPGCMAFAHKECRELLARRFQIYWSLDKQWYWGTVVDERVDESGFMQVRYDDGVETGDEEDDVEEGRLVKPSPSAPTSSSLACICSKGVAVADSALVSGFHACSVCCAPDTRAGSEQGMANEMVYCGTCDLPVHVFCYGQTSAGDEFKRSMSVTSKQFTFTCDVCAFREDGGDASTLQCSLCASGDGALRRQADGSWAHISCMQYSPQVEWKLAANHSADAEALCSRASGCGGCFKMIDTSTFDITRARARSSSKGKGKAKAAVAEPQHRCSAADCPDRTKGLLAICGGQGRNCRKATHISCGQRLGSGWHLLEKELSSSTAIEVLCDACSDLELIIGANEKLKYCTKRAPQVASLIPYVSNDEYERASWTFADGFCGPIGGVRRAAVRLGGSCIGACDNNREFRAVYHMTFGSRQPPLSDITEMGKDARVLRSCDIFFATFCCKPFSQAGLCKGIDDPQYGNNLELLIDTLRERRKRGVLDKCLIIENVPNMLNKVDHEMLMELGYHFQCFIVSGELFRCANVRERLILVGFLDQKHLDAFTPPPPQCDAPTPLSTVLKECDVELHEDLFLSTNDLAKAKKDSKAIIVSRGFPRGAASPTGSYGGISGIGTLICVDKAFDAQTTPLTLEDLKRCDPGSVRRLQWAETLSSFSFTHSEFPALSGNSGNSLTFIHEAVAQTVCVNVIEAFAAEALAAMGKTQPRSELCARVQSTNGGRLIDMGPADNWSKEGSSETGVRRRKYARFPSAKKAEELRAAAAAAAAGGASSSQTALVAWTPAMLVHVPDDTEDLILED